VSIRGDCRVGVAHDDVRERGYDNGRVTPDGVEVIAAFAIVLVSVTWVGVCCCAASRWHCAHV